MRIKPLIRKRKFGSHMVLPETKSALVIKISRRYCLLTVWNSDLFSICFFGRLDFFLRATLPKFRATWLGFRATWLRARWLSGELTVNHPTPPFYAISGPQTFFKRGLIWLNKCPYIFSFWPSWHRSQRKKMQLNWGHNFVKQWLNFV